VRPEHAAARVVRIAFLIGMSVMDAVRRDLLDGAALKGERAEHRHAVFERLRNPEAPVGEHAMIAKAYADRQRRVPEHGHRGQCAPREESGPECGQRTEVDGREPKSDRPVRWSGRFRGFHVRRLCTSLCEAVAAVDGAVAARIERKFGDAAALAARGLEGLASRPIVGAMVAAGRSAMRLTSLAALRTTSGIAREALLGEEVLLRRSACELLVAVAASQGLVASQQIILLEACRCCDRFRRLMRFSEGFLPTIALRRRIA